MEIISRKAAKAQGLSRYYTGKPCKRGHVAERWTGSEQCVICAASHVKKYRDTHPEKQEEWAKRRERSGRLAEAQSKPEYKEWKREYMAEYRQRNRPYYRAKRQEYEANKRNATPPWADRHKIRLVHQKAGELSKAWGMAIHVDHIYPIRSDWVCGLNVWENLQLLDSNLNCRKNNGKAIGE